LREKSRKLGRFAVHVEGKSVAVVGAAYLHEARLAVGVMLDEAAGDRLLLAARKMRRSTAPPPHWDAGRAAAHELERWLLQRGLSTPTSLTRRPAHRNRRD